MRIIITPLTQLDVVIAYGVWKLRQDVFVVEQDCPYEDLDGRDLEPTTMQVVMLGEAAPDSVSDGGTRVLGTARVLDDGDVWRIGRVALVKGARGRGLSDEVMRAALKYVEDSGDRRDVVLDAQSPLTRWYGKHGFEPDGAEFLEDGIPHTPMRLRRAM
ncbi:GNAT family N-acetyltransferase [Promicromonospora thailandica]|uniref:ElaA protein n=1 Tax=Promicromonospora thailandica TaxID=765201 RepID=A0A9X2G123_9MICO|nr:GNAT family N-acetyltransferase [Promicromonospora thailandica]MCP2264884.1 ElaA protein [Promicromonospora thailandica]BFF18850.1 GNAT family N-acetyltransferase [Promicromonospora thailandica]